METETKPKVEDYVVGHVVALVAESKNSPWPEVIFGRIKNVEDRTVKVVLMKTIRESPYEFYDVEDEGENEEFVTDYVGIPDGETDVEFKISKFTGLASLPKVEMIENLHLRIRMAWAKEVMEDSINAAYPSRISKKQFEEEVKDEEDEMVHDLQTYGQPAPREMVMDGSTWHTVQKCHNAIFG